MDAKGPFWFHGPVSFREAFEACRIDPNNAINAEGYSGYFRLIGKDRDGEAWQWSRSKHFERAVAIVMDFGPSLQKMQWIIQGGSPHDEFLRLKELYHRPPSAHAEPKPPGTIIRSCPGLTPTETEVLDHLVAAWNKFLTIPGMPTEEVADFRRSINYCQQALGFQVAKRAQPEIWNIADVKDSLTPGGKVGQS